jgi:MFS family permease
MLFYAVLFKRLRLGIVTAVVAGAFFLLWEAFIFFSAGRSHFLAQSQTYGSVNLMAKYAYLAWPLVTIMGAVAPFFALLALIAWGIRRTWIVVGAALIAVGFLLIAFAPARFQEWGGDKQALAHITFSVFGVGFFAGILFVIKRQLLNSASRRSTLSHLAEYRFELFLTGWWLLEILAYFVLSPIPAVRRMLLLLVVSTLLIGRLLARSQTVTVRTIRWLAVGSVVLGLLFYIVDFRDAYVEKAAIEKSRRTISTMPSAGNTWYLGRWGLQFYGEQAGMKPVLPDESELRSGDFVVTTDSVYAPEPVLAHLRRYQMTPVAEFALADRLPLSTMLGFYNSGIPIHHQDGPRRRVKIYRIE